MVDGLNMSKVAQAENKGAIQEIDRTRPTGAASVGRLMTDSSELDRNTYSVQPSNRWGAVGIFLVVLAAYILSSPGRIDIIDGQARYDVAYNWILEGRPVLRDPWIAPFRGVRGRGGLVYSYYGAPASVFSMPLMWLGMQQDVIPGETSRFLFSLTSPIFGALIAAVLFLFYRELGLGSLRALAWAGVSAFTTLVWPTSDSSFDNAQHAAFAILALYFGFLSATRKSRFYAALGGLAAGILFLYQEYFALIIPVLALATLDWDSAVSQAVLTGNCPPKSLWGRFWSHARADSRALVQVFRSGLRSPGRNRESGLRFLCFLALSMVGVVLALVYNDVRFGSYFSDGKLRLAAQRAYPLFGNPIAGFLTLLASPGKSIFLYSPPIILAVLGVRRLWHRAPELALAIVGASAILASFLSCISFAGGDWCWGPRYLVVLLPLWALALPFYTSSHKGRRNLVIAILSLGLVVQALALSVENQHFFFERGLNDFFWAEDPWFYFKHSALLARLSEATSLKNGVPPTAQRFNSIPIPDWCTYTILGPPPKMPRKFAPQWMRQFKIFYLPRPWPIWMWWVKPDLRPINLEAWLAGLFGVLLLGITLIFRQLQIPWKARDSMSTVWPTELASHE